MRAMMLHVFIILSSIISFCTAGILRIDELADNRNNWCPNSGVLYKYKEKNKRTCKQDDGSWHVSCLENKKTCTCNGKSDREHSEIILLRKQFDKGEKTLTIYNRKAPCDKCVSTIVKMLEEEPGEPDTTQIQIYWCDPGSGEHHSEHEKFKTIGEAHGTIDDHDQMLSANVNPLRTAINNLGQVGSKFNEAQGEEPQQLEEQDEQTNNLRNEVDPLVATQRSLREDGERTEKEMMDAMLQPNR